MTFLDSTVDVRSVLIRHYWQVTPVFLAYKTVVSLQLHMRRGKVLGKSKKKGGVGGRKKKSKRSYSPNPYWSRFLLRFCPLPQSTSKPLLRKLLSSLPACHSRSQLVPKLCRVTPLLKKNYWYGASVFRQETRNFSWFWSAKQKTEQHFKQGLIVPTPLCVISRIAPFRVTTCTVL